MNKSKVFMIFGILLLVVSIIGSTFAYYIWTSGSEDETKIVTSVGSATVYFDGGKAIENASLRPVESKEYGIVKNISVQANKTGINFNLYLDITSIDNNLKDKSFRYQFYKEDTLVKEGNFSSDYLDSNLVNCSVNNTNHIVLLSNETISTTKLNYSLYIWVDGLQDNPKEMMGKSFNFLLHAEGTGALLKEGVIPDITQLPESQKKTFAYKILSDYYYADKSDISNNGVTYHYDIEHNLMSDVGGNVRYYGANPNNYIYFNCDDYSNQTSDTCEVWRIIGVFDGKIKIMRGEGIGNYSWDNKQTSFDTEIVTGKNDWTEARLMRMLNPIENESTKEIGDGLYWNRENGECYSGRTADDIKTCDMSSLGLKNSTTKGLITKATYSLLGWNALGVYADQIYNYERTDGKVYKTTKSKRWTGYVAIPYASDYAYAVDLRQCNNLTLDKYNDTVCESNNWIKPIITNNSKNSGWLLTPGTVYPSHVWYVYSNGLINHFTHYLAGDENMVVPVFSLDSTLEINLGDGSSSSQYQIKVS